MATAVIDDHQLQADIDQLRSQFPGTRDLYREACVLLFFRYGITPTANKLYQCVHKGSMSAPVEALNLFWKELRDKSRMRLERPDLPDALKDAAGQFAVTLWQQAQQAAQQDFTAQISAAEIKVSSAEQNLQKSCDDVSKLEIELQSSQAELESALKRLSESEKNNAVHISALAGLEKTLKSLQNERDQLERTLEVARQGFSRDLDKINVTLRLADERYRALEAKLLVDVDKERQRTVQLLKDLKLAKDAVRMEQERHHKSVAALNKSNAALHEKLGVTQGLLSQMSVQLKQTSQKLLAAEKRLLVNTSKRQLKER